MAWEDCNAADMSETYDARPGRAIDRGKSRISSPDVTSTRATTPFEGSGAYGNTNARGWNSGSSRPNGRAR